MPKWTYLFTMEDVISESNSSESDSTDIVHNDTLLQWDSETKRIVAWGTAMWWVPYGLLREMMMHAGNKIRTRLHKSERMKYGFHLDVNISLLFGDVNSETEMCLARLISTWESNVFIARIPPIFLDSNVFTPGSRVCRLRNLTYFQQTALEWMHELEEKVGTDMQLKSTTPVPGTNIVYSTKKRAFVNNYRPEFQYVSMCAGILAGYRGTGKSLIVRELVRAPLENRPVSMFPMYEFHSNLIIVPDHLFTQWENVLCSNGEDVKGVQLVKTVTDAATWSPDMPPPRVVLASMSAIMSELYKNMKQYEKYTESMVCRRKGNMWKTLVSSTWDRIIVDEFLNHAGMGVALRYMNTHFTWAIQGGATPRDEVNMIESLLDVQTSSGDIGDAVVFRRLPIVLPLCSDTATTVSLVATETEQKLHELLSDEISQCGVYTNHSMDMFTDFSSWKEVLDMPRGMTIEQPPPPCNPMLDDSWLFDTMHDVNFTFTVNGMAMNIPLDMTGGREEEEGEEDEEEEEEDYDDDEDEDDEDDDDEDDETSEVVASQVYFDETVRGFVDGGEIPTCGVCLETECNVIFECGHLMCFVCSVKLVQTQTPRCPHCRYKICNVLHVGGFNSTSVAWIRRFISKSQKADEKVLFIGSVYSGVSYLKSQIDSPCIVLQAEIAGKVQTGVTTCVLLDAGASVPITMSNSRKVGIKVINLRMEF